MVGYDPLVSSPSSLDVDVMWAKGSARREGNSTSDVVMTGLQ
jgi:hypothetical protein